MQRLIDRALGQGDPAHDHLVIGDEVAATHLRWAANALTTNGTTHTRRLTVIAVAIGAAGTAAGVVSHSGAIDDHTLRELVRAADRTARNSPPAADAQPLIESRGYDGRWDLPPADATVATLDEFLPALAGCLGRARARRRLLYGYAERRVRTTYLASSTGLRLRHVHPTGVLDLTARTERHSASAWAGRDTATLGEADLVACEAEVDDGLSWAAGGAVSLPAASYEVLLPPSCVADLMLHLYLAAGGREAHDGRSAFGRPGHGSRLGERLGPTGLTLRSDPAHPGLECAPFVVARASTGTSSVFDNGLALAATRWITDGVLTALVQTRHSARLTGHRPTGQIDNLILDGPPGGGSLADMVASTRRGLLLTSLWYLRDVDPRDLLLTGLTRDGVYLVEHGEVVGAVNNFRFNESPIGLLDRITGIGRTEPALPREWGEESIRMAMPTLRIGGFRMSAVSHGI